MLVFFVLLYSTVFLYSGDMPSIYLLLSKYCQLEFSKLELEVFVLKLEVCELELDIELEVCELWGFEHKKQHV